MFYKTLSSPFTEGLKESDELGLFHTQASCQPRLHKSEASEDKGGKGCSNSSLVFKAFSKKFEFLSFVWNAQL